MAADERKTTIYGRVWSAAITLKNGDKQSTIVTSSPQRVAFDIKYTPYSDIGVAEFKFYGFDQNTNNAIIENGSIIEFSAGYVESAERLFYGEIMNVYHQRSGVDAYIRVFARSMTKDSLSATTNKTWGPGTSYLDIVSDAVKTMDGTLVLIPEDEASWLNSLGKTETSGYSFSGYSIELVSDLAHRFGFKIYPFSASNSRQSSGVRSQFYMCQAGAFSNARRHVISADTGMEGSPIYTTNGVVVSARLNSAIHPCDKIVVRSDYYAASAGDPYYSNQRTYASNKVSEYYAESITHRGDLETGLWTTTIVGRDKNDK